MISCFALNSRIGVWENYADPYLSVISKGKFASLNSPINGLGCRLTGALSDERTEVVYAPYLNEVGEIAYKDVTLKVVEVTE